MKLRGLARIIESLIIIAAMQACGGKAAPAAANLPPTAAAPLPAAAAPQAFYATEFENKPSVAAMTELGRALFSDPALSASGKIACTSCHDPAHAYGPANDRAVQRGGADLRASGIRAAPSLRYAHNVPPFSEHHFDEAVDESVDQGPTGGHDWDGRADTAHDQARGPLLSPFEMANTGEDQIVARLGAGANAERFRAVYGAHVFDDPALAFKGLLMALETFQQSPADFYPFDSKFDAWLRKKAQLTPQELRGFAVFNDEKKGNCASCHPSQIRAGSFPQFTDFGYVAVGVPRNAAIPANRDPAYHDLGLCGPVRTDLSNRPEFCGFFRAPSLRNVALRQRFFHNGSFRDLRKVLEFYAQRDTDPGKWYPRGRDGQVLKFDDLPPQYRANVNTEPPFDRKPGDRPALTAAEIDDMLAFLKTLNDGYKP
jgi:cytochrome c peroxidase